MVSCYALGSSADMPASLQTILQDPSTPAMEGIFTFNNQLLSLIISIIFLTAWVISVVLNVNMELVRNDVSIFNHSSLIEIVWTSVPAMILLSLSIPSFSLLYAMDEVTAAELSMKIVGHQWFWSYESSDFISCLKGRNLKYSSYLLNSEFLKCTPVGLARNLETNRRLVLPANSHLRLLVTAVDVLHSWTIPSFGLKIDACPGRLNQANVFVKRFGVFFGQCSEICGVNHGFMPISVISMSIEQFHFLITCRLK
jgi:cytochrome c oxidase subunit 2